MAMNDSADMGKGHFGAAAGELTWGQARTTGTLRDLAFLVGLLILAMLLRTLAIDSQALWNDEAQTLSLSLFPIGEMFWQPTDPTPFLYYALHQIFVSPGASAGEIRMLPAVIGVASVALMYALGRLAGGRLAGLFCAALLAVWTSHVDYSMEARAYSLLGFTTLLSFTGTVLYGHAVTGRVAGHYRGPGLALLVAGNVLGFYTHVIAAFPIAATSAIVALTWLLHDRRRWLSFVTTYAIMALLAVPGVLRLLAQARVGDNFDWLVQPGIVTVVSTMADIFLPIGLWDNALTNGLDIRLAAKFLAIPVLFAAFGLALVFARHRLWAFAKAQPHTALLVLALLVSPLAIWLVGYVARPLFLGRVLLFSIPGAILLLAAVIAVPDSRRARAYGTALIALMFGSTLAFGMMREKEDWRGALAHLAARAEAGDVIAVCADFNFPSARHAATTTIGRAVLVPNVGGQVVLLENGLGSDGNWADTYFAAIQRGKLLPATTLALEPGQSVWRIDAACDDGMAKSQTLDRALLTLDPAPSVEWAQDARYNDHIEIRRYRVTTPATLSIADGRPGNN